MWSWCDRSRILKCLCLFVARCKVWSEWHGKIRDLPCEWIAWYCSAGMYIWMTRLCYISRIYSNSPWRRTDLYFLVTAMLCEMLMRLIVNYALVFGLKAFIAWMLLRNIHIIVSLGCKGGGLVQFLIAVIWLFSIAESFNASGDSWPRLVLCTNRNFF